VKISSIIRRLETHIKKNALGKVIVGSESCLCLRVLGEQYYDFFWMPEFAFYSKRSRPKYWESQKWKDFPPDVVFQCVDRCYFHSVNDKSIRFLSCGVKVVVCIDTVERTLHVYRRNKPVQLLKEKAQLKLPEIPGFNEQVGTLLPETRPVNATPKRTLLNPKSYPADRQPGVPGLCFTEWLDGLSEYSGPEWYDQEIGIFDSSSRTEAHLFETQTDLAGPLKLTIDRQKFDLTQKPCAISGWVEEDRIQFTSCEARGILLCEFPSVTNWLVRQKSWRRLNLVIATSFGIPGATTRRLLNRISSQFKIPVYLIGDNDTWSYYIFSILKRGSIAPFQTVPQLAINNLRFLGLRAAECGEMGYPRRLMRKWKKRWDLRLNAMKKFACFQSDEWQREFERFRAQRGALDLLAMIAHFKENGRVVPHGYRNFVNKYLLPRIERGLWLE
jgi:hypothetical protein